MINDKLVSVIIPTYKRPKNLIRAIDSVLKQTYRPIEIIVVDDNGAGTNWQLETEKILDLYIRDNLIIYIKHDKNRNGAAARNTGLKISKGDFYTFLDDDDFLYPSKIEKQILFLEKHLEFDMVYCGFNTVNRWVKTCNVSKSGNLQLPLLKLRWGFGSGSNPLFRRKVFDIVGGFDDSFLRHQDFEYMIRCFRNFKIGAVSEILLIKYINSNSNRPNVENLIKIKEHFLDTFRNDIEKYSISDQKEIYRNQWFEISYIALGEKKYKISLAYLKKAISYKIPTFKQILKYLYMLFTLKQYSR